MVDEQYQVDELRKTFLNELEEKGIDAIHPKDLERVKNEDNWLKRFLLHHDGNVKEALNMLWETISWRKEFRANEINDIVRMDLICQGGFFPHGHDKDGCTLFVFKCKKYVKGANSVEDLKRCVVYWFERLERQDHGKSISLFFDMEGCGLSNMDMEFIQYLIGLFKKYYPYFLNYILIFEMPWVLSAAFKIIKSWLPEKAVQKIKQIGKKDIKDYVPLDQALICWGGTNDYTFSFLPESQEKNENGLDSGMTSTTPTPTPHLIASTNRKVHFADGSLMSDNEQNNAGDGKTATEINGIVVDPSATINFIKEGQELVSCLELKNIDSYKIFSYKLKTTSPEKFRVRPSMGCLVPGAKAIIQVTLLPGFQVKGLTRDKFLVMSTQIEENEMAQEMSQLWKDTSGRKVFQHRLVCSQLNDIHPNNSNNSPNSALTGISNNFATTNNGSNGNDANQNQMINQLNRKLDKLLEEQMKLGHNLKRTQYILYTVILLLIVMVLVIAYFLQTGFLTGLKLGQDNNMDKMYCKPNDPSVQ